jgi:hypothetical protein
MCHHHHAPIDEWEAVAEELREGDGETDAERSADDDVAEDDVAVEPPRPADD